MNRLEAFTEGLRAKPRRWLVTGVAGFIGSNLAQSLLEADQEVVGLDNFATGKRANLDEVRALVGPGRWARFRFVEGDVASPEACRDAVAGVDAILHQAALGSVPRSIEEPLGSNAANVTGHLALLEAARRAGVRRFVYAYAQKPEQYNASSPITYAENVRAPIFVIQGKHDTRTPPRQRELYEAELKALGKSIEVEWFEAGHTGISAEQWIHFQERMMMFEQHPLEAQNR